VLFLFNTKGKIGWDTHSSVPPRALIELRSNKGRLRSSAKLQMGGGDFQVVHQKAAFIPLWKRERKMDGLHSLSFPGQLYPWRFRTALALTWVQICVLWDRGCCDISLWVLCDTWVCTCSCPCTLTPAGLEMLSYFFNWHRAL